MPKRIDSAFTLTPAEQKRYDLYKKGLEVKEILATLGLASSSRASVYLAIEKGKQIDQMDTGIKIKDKPATKAKKKGLNGYQ